MKVKQIFSRLKNIVNLSLLFVCSAAYADLDDLPYIKDLVPKDSAEIQAYWRNFEKTFKQNVQAFTRYLGEKEGDQALRTWGRIIKQTLIARTDLGYLIPIELYPNTELAKTAQQYFEQANNLYTKTVQDENFQAAVANYVLGVRDFLPDEAQFFYDFLSRFQRGKNANLINKALESLESIPKAPYIYLEGAGVETIEGKKISVLNANLLFMPKYFTYYFGGVRPWEKRMRGIVKSLRRKNSDVIALQEMHDEESSFALFRTLKHQYPYFYLNIGVDNAVVDPEEISMNSGLFVASKNPIANPKFVRFQAEGRQKGIHKGFFYGTLIVDGKPFCYLISTHLNPHVNETAVRVREEEAQMIVSTIKSLQKAMPLPALVVGDLNVSYGTQEWENSTLNKAFIDGYTSKKPTCTDYFNDLVWTPIKERSKVKARNYIYDYALVYRTHPMWIESEVFPLYQLDEPEDALSDHQAIFSEIRISN